MRLTIANHLGIAAMLSIVALSAIPRAAAQVGGAWTATAPSELHGAPTDTASQPLLEARVVGIAPTRSANEEDTRRWAKQDRYSPGARDLSETLPTPYDGRLPNSDLPHYRFAPRTAGADEDSLGPRDEHDTATPSDPFLPVPDSDSPIDVAWPDLDNTLTVIHTPLNYQVPPTAENLPYDWFGGCRPVEHWCNLDMQVRSYYNNDQRIEFTGQEATFGAEGVLAAHLVQQAGSFEFGVLGELFINQPFDRNILVDTPERASYRGNFEIEPLEISQALLTCRRGDVLVGMGKMVTPFGRTYFPLYRNDLSDAPFIRTEAILWRETGFLVQYDPGPWMFTAALTNGSEDRDTNSSKGIVARVGIDLANFAVGASVKWHDGIGSEGQKAFNNHAGVDFMFRHGPLIISGEAIYDEYGYRRPGFDPNDITWGRSIYHRDQNLADDRPISGFGYYVNAVYEAPGWTGVLNYGEFYPEQIGDPIHDVTTRRGFAKWIVHLSTQMDVYTMFMLENTVRNAQAGRDRQGWNVLVGLQYTL